MLGIEPAGFTEIGLDQADDLQVGDFVLAIGNPLDGEQSTTFGIVSGLHRSDPGTDYSDLIATDALIAQGNSGGPLVNLRAELVGINIIRLVSRLFSPGRGSSQVASWRKVGWLREATGPPLSPARARAWNRRRRRSGAAHAQQDAAFDLAQKAEIVFR